MISNDVKFMLNELQLRLSSNTDKVLLIFDDKKQLDDWNQEYDNDLENSCDIIPVTIAEINYRNRLIGMRFKRYEFVINKEVG